MFREVDSNSDIEMVATLAKEIWHQHFTPLIGIDQVRYMLKHFQSVEAITKQITDDNYSYFLVIDDTTPLGYFAYYPTADFLYLSKFYLRESARGKGYGKKVLTFLEKSAKTLNLPAVQLNVFKGNRDTISIYNRMGFEVIDKPQIDIGNGFILDDYVMRKSTD